MKKWILKAIVQKIISFLPFSRPINYFFQKYVTKGVYLSDDYFFDRLGHAIKHLQLYRKHTQLSFPEKALEIGTGWYPIVPICFFLAGSKVIYSIDIELLTSKEKLKTTIDKFVQAYNNHQLEAIQILPKRYQELCKIIDNWEQLDFKQITEKLCLHYVIEDARKLSLPDHSIDLINSNNTFEHIYPSILMPILKEFNRVVKKQNGVMSHFIDMSDHFAHFDHSISIYNFLKFSDSQWKWIDNSMQPQNRLRIYDYIELFRQVNIPVQLVSKRDGDIPALKQIKLAAKYQSHPIADVAVSHCHFISVYQDF